ncbi:MAG: helix-turn-helix domain-containing protein [Clostridiales bacterium]|jgi:transcriptional regulator with XRE-family HTH domain|nr:helix-turn-helix domain-containing protein [Clostridiales bacterium]
MNSLKKIIGENIRHERQLRNMSLDDLGDILGLTSGFIGLVERGKRGTDIENLLQIAKVFETSLDALTTDKRLDGKLRENDDDPLAAAKSSLFTMAFDLDEAEIRFIVAVISELKELRASR